MQEDAKIVGLKQLIPEITLVNIFRGIKYKTFAKPLEDTWPIDRRTRKVKNKMQ